MRRPLRWIPSWSSIAVCAAQSEATQSLMYIPRELFWWSRLSRPTRHACHSESDWGTIPRRCTLWLGTDRCKQRADALHSVGELWTGSKVSSNRGFWWDTSTNIPLETVCHMMHVSFVVVNHMFMMPYQLWRNFKVFVLITEWSMRISIYQSWYWHHCCDPHHSISQQQIEMWQSRASWPWNLFLGELIAWRGCKSMCKEQSPRHVRSQRRLLLPWRRCPNDDVPFNRYASTLF